MSSTPARPLDSMNRWIRENYAAPIDSIKFLFRIAYVAFAFCSALLIGALKGIVVGPIAGLLLILGNIGVILGLFPAHVAWTLYSIIKTSRINAALKLAVLFALPILSCLWLALSIAGSILIGIGYGFFAPLVSTFEAFRHNTEMKKFLHSIVDGTWGTIKGSCTVVRDFADFCYHSYPLYLKEFRESTSEQHTYSIRLVEIPKCIVVGLVGLIVDVPLYTIIALLKSPYMLFKGWQRLLHDVISREGLFLETACVPVAGLAFLVWPLIVVGSILLAILSSIFVGLYGSIVVYKERSFRRGVAYVVAIVAEFDEYTNDWLYLREGSLLPKPKYQQRSRSYSSESSVGASMRRGVKNGSVRQDAPALFVPTLAPSRSVRETIQEVKMVQIWEEWMKCIELRGKEVIDANIVTEFELTEWLKAKEAKHDIIGLGLPAYAFLHSLLYSIEAGSNGLLLSNGIEVNHQNRPHERLLDWFFHPVMVLKEQIKVIKLEVEEVRFLEKLVLFNGDNVSMQSWENGSVAPQDALKTAQIQAISRRLVGMSRTITKFPTYRRKYRHVVKTLIAYCQENEVPGSTKMQSNRSASSAEIAPPDV
ncbi:uncharacterized membrane protein At3g27390 [Phalaenopsis equestris]|uniref:uncharacterized membrane protein At3g27390 n=1 Tax=Phalaenopsis equestris TaxID=78828 RepID=UPI0009E36549|nr:uncharacterized membrane protein At3g27390 [Phalaenopsis equestris]